MDGSIIGVAVGGILTVSTAVIGGFWGLNNRMSEKDKRIYDKVDEVKTSVGELKTDIKAMSSHVCDLNKMCFERHSVLDKRLDKLEK